MSNPNITGSEAAKILLARAAMDAFKMGVLPRDFAIAMKWMQVTHPNDVAFTASRINELPKV